MRLLDRIAQTSSPLLIQRPDGVCVVLPGVETHKARVQQCAQRFVLDLDASRLCRSLIDENSSLLDPSNPLLRSPFVDLWLEWLEEADGVVTRVGALVSADATGRRGRVRSFWEEAGEVSVAPCEIVFDLDRMRHTPIVQAREPIVLRSFLSHLRLELDPEWRAFYAAQGPGAVAQAVERLSACCWSDAPCVLAFGVLLSLSAPLRVRHAELDRLNAARIKRRKPALLEHSEVGLVLGERFGGAPGMCAAGRAGPRLHQVRGHVVRRGEQMFWRTSHLRGDARVALARRTVNVRAR